MIYLKNITFSTFFYLLLFIPFYSVNSFAGEVNNLYEARVLISNDDEKADRKTLLKKVFHKVLIKVTGSSNYLKSPNAQKIVASSQSLVQKFAFQSEPILEHKKSLNEEPENSLPPANSKHEQQQTKQNQQEIPTQTWFWARFNQYSTDQLLKQNKLAVWGNLRPNTLIWLSIENPPQINKNQQKIKKMKREIITSANYPSIISLLNQQSERRGILLLFPFGDLQDKNKLSLSDLWGNYARAISAASLRYHPQATLAVRIYQEPSGLWIAKWSLYVLDKVQNWQTKHESLDIILSQGINSLADRLAELFALQANTLDDKSTIIQINNVTDFKAFQLVNSYFKRIAAIQSAHLVQVKGDSISYRIHYIGDEKHLIQSLILGEVLQKIDNSSHLAQSPDNDTQRDYVPVIISDEKPNSTLKQTTIKADPNNPKANIINTQQENKPSIVEPVSIQDTLHEIIADTEFWLTQ